MGDPITDCVVCGHTTHRVNACTICGCEDWKRADHLSATALRNINNFLLSEGRMAIRCMADILDILCEAFPEAEKAVIARREQLRKEHKDATDSPAAGAPEEETGSGQGV